MMPDVDRGYVARVQVPIFSSSCGMQVHTPPPDCFLNGITRQTVMQLAEDHGYEIVERHIKPEELPDAQEIFVTGTGPRLSGEIDGMVIKVMTLPKHLWRLRPIGGKKHRILRQRPSILSPQTNKSTAPAPFCWLRVFFGWTEWLKSG